VSSLVHVRDTAPRLLTFAIKPFGRRELDSVRVAAVMSGKGAAMRWTRVCGAELDLGAKKRLEARGRGDAVLISLSPLLAISVAEAPLIFFFLFPGPEPAAWA